MPISNKLKFIYQEKNTRETTTSSSYVLQGTMLSSDKLIGGH